MIDLLSLTKSASSAASLVTGEAFMTALDAIGGVHMQAAQDAFRKVAQSNNPREAMNRALCHLEAAHAAFRGSWSSSTVYFRPVKCGEQAEKDIDTCCLMALIHLLLRDDDGLVIHAIRLADEAYAFLDGKGATRLRMFAAIVNPLNVIDAVISDAKLEAKANKQGMTIQQQLVRRRSDYQEFKQFILGSLSGPAADAEGIK
jgi:hypothetical protein